MPIQVLMPQFGESVEEATITKWLKAEGDRVEEFEALVEVNTDKVDTEIPAPAAGILLKIAQPDEGSTVKVGMLLAWIGEPGEPIPEDKSASETETHAQISEGEEIPSVATAGDESKFEVFKRKVRDILFRAVLITSLSLALTGRTVAFIYTAWTRYPYTA